MLDKPLTVGSRLNSPAVNFNAFGSMMIYMPKRHRGIKIECCDLFAGEVWMFQN